MRLSHLATLCAALGLLCALPASAQTAKPVFPPDSAMARIQKKGLLTVGARQDLPGVVQLNPLTQAVEGFDADVARAIGARLGLAPAGVRFVEVPSATRENAVNQGLVDILIGAYVITPKRRALVGQAGPYVDARAYLYVRSENQHKYKRPEDIKGKRICTTPTGTSAPVIQQYGGVFLPFEDVSACTQQVVNGTVDGKMGNDLNNLGFVKQFPDLVPADVPAMRTEGWGVGLKKDDEQFCRFTNGVLKDLVKSGEWQRLWDKHFAPLGVSPQKPPQVGDVC
ncbi:MAG: transporter substrate-binding domain-containing protein [Rhodocyclaceae bacterium]